MLEAVVERRLKRLESYGFKVLKLRTPGYSGSMDRMILWPKVSPHPPSFVEIKRPGETPRPLQVEVAVDWRARGVDVRDYCDTVEAVDRLIKEILGEMV